MPACGASEDGMLMRGGTIDNRVCHSKTQAVTCRCRQGGGLRFPLPVPGVARLEYKSGAWGANKRNDHGPGRG